MKIGAYIAVAIVAFPYKFCCMINILLDEDRETGAAFPSFWEYWERKSRVWQYLERGKGREMQVTLPHNGYKVPQKVAVESMYGLSAPKKWPYVELRGVACVANESVTRKLERGQKKLEGVGEGRC